MARSDAESVQYYVITFGQWVLRIADNDLTWIGLNWMRPARDRQIGWAYMLFSSVLLGLPGFSVGAGILYFVFRHIDTLTLWILFALVMAVELPLHILVGHYWNKRAMELATRAPRPGT